MNLKQLRSKLTQDYTIVAEIDLTHWYTVLPHLRENWVHDILLKIHKDVYADSDRIVFRLDNAQAYNSKNILAADLLSSLQLQLNDVDISNFFVIIISNDSIELPKALKWVSSQSIDPVPITLMNYQDESTDYNYNSSDPIKVSLGDLMENQKHLLTKSKSFCMYPWIHLHAYPTGQAYPCCMADMQYPLGSVRENTIKEIWNNDAMKQVRVNMIADQPNAACHRCYEQEKYGFFSGRQSANKHHGHHIDRIMDTKQDGTLEEFALTYWDIRFSNLCNLSCRSCGHIFSSSWHKDQSILAGPEWKKNNKVLNYAGRYATDVWEQLLEHIDHVEQIYFAGGEPLLMEEHYNILDELDRRGRYDVRLIYNTNFTHTQLKDRSVFDYWKKFDSVSVGASLDASGPRAEYIRKGTDWQVVEKNRIEMMQSCPDVDFYISPTLSIMNAWHLPDFHKDWVNRGLIKPQDLNVNILQDPAYYRADIAPNTYKDLLIARFKEHIEWLKPQDQLLRATTGFESAINCLESNDNTNLIDTFWRKTHELDSIRNEKWDHYLPELKALK